MRPFLMMGKKTKSQFDRHRSDSAAMFEGSRIRKIELQRDFTQVQTIGQTAQDSSLARSEMTR